MKKKFLFTATTILFFCFPSAGQKTWAEFEITKKLIKDLELYVAPEVRFEEQLKLKEYFVEAGLEYKIHKYLSAGAGYRLGNNKKNNGSTESYGRFTLDAKTGLEWKNMEPGLRIRYTNSDDFSDDEEEKTNYLRCRFKLDYSIEKTGLKPYAAVEIYRNLREKEFDKAKYEAGATYKIDKHHRVGAYYRINDYLIKDKSLNIIGISYKFKF